MTTDFNYNRRWRSAADRPNRLPGRATTNARRRGVLLLVVLGMLAMFGLIAVTFVILTGQAKRGAESHRRIDQYDSDPKEDLDNALMQVLRGTTNPQSVIGPHSLLEDIYGNPETTGTITAAPDPLNDVIMGGQLLNIPCGLANPEQYAGCVLTMLDGPAAGQSTRIVAAPAGGGVLQVVAFDGTEKNSTGTVTVNGYALTDFNRNDFIINGSPFSGTGFGYDTSADPQLAKKDALGREYALLPNPAASGFSLNDYVGPGGANEDYDAVDFQNMLLAAQIVNTSGDLIATIPSLHRPALIDYWKNKNATDWNGLDSDLRRKICLRPIGAATDHPSFTGSNPSFNAAWDGQPGSDLNSDGIEDQWDVDNDGDGVADSVWVDLGSPVRSMPDGRLYKPLYAILCLDMDGRLNLNAHGCPAQTDAKYGNAITDQFAGGAGSATLTLPRGQGYGPADINLRPLLGTDYQDILDSRYVDSNVPGSAGNDLLSYNQHFDYPDDYTDFTTPTSYGTPPDMKAKMAVGLDLRGQPIYSMLAGDWAGAASDDPYELNLARSKRSSVDAPFTPSELERLLRPYDIDASSLPSRLYSLTATDGDLISRRHEITTESWDVPCPNTAEGDKNIVELLSAKLQANAIPDVPAAIAELLPPEVLAGLKMDINRPFGDGQDDAPTNGVVDEPGEAATDTIDLYDTPSTSKTVALDHDNDGTAGVSFTGEARQLYARHLYVMLLLLTECDMTDPDEIRMIAQWAANIVDFRDRDSIMTPFEYDADPFTNDDGDPTNRTWDADGDLSTPNPNCYVVWGCERPELLITETLAFHDRRTEDLATNGQIADPESDLTNDFDQRFKPQGSLFIELYNPWTTGEPVPGGLHYDSDSNGLPDLYDSDGDGVGDTAAVDLTRVSSGSPVWRMIIVDGSELGEDPDDADSTKLPTIERAVYFVDSSATLPTDGTVKFQPEDPLIAPILPGRYMVVGPGEPTDTTSTTYIGFANGANPGAPGSSRRIRLTPDIDPTTTGQVEVFADGTTDDLAAVTIQNPVAAVINSPRRLNISEPDIEYDNTNYNSTTGYMNPHDKPFDTATEIMESGRKDHFKVVHLQRLANPLLPFNANENPYRTVDSMSIDLNSFNGLDSTADLNDGKAAVDLIARERGERAEVSDAGIKKLWRREPYSDPPEKNNVFASVTNHNFDKPLHHTLGYLNDPFGIPLDATAGSYEGDPQNPFPWLTWNNRPFVSHLELMLVPSWHSSKLLHKYNLAINSINPYKNYWEPFPHMISFFSESSSIPPKPPNWKVYRLLDYLHVPSRFVGTAIQANPTSAVGGTGHSFHPPFNRIPTYREPGKINLNTIFSKTVWDGLMNGAHTDATWEKFVSSRRGYGATDDMVSLGSSMPTRFVRPFRSAAGAELVPLANMVPNREIDATLLRSDEIDPATASDTPLFVFSSNNAYNDTDRNPYFRYQGLQRLGNLVTTRSNVYSIWITVGYFEVEEAPIWYDPAIYPDGYRLGAEFGSDTGEIQRHRAFYMIDRTVPVGFQRGKDHNVEDTILIKRFIE